MEPDETKLGEGQNLPHKPVETNYSKHQEDPGPSPQAVNEYDKNGAGPILKWLIPILVIALLIYWLIFR
ncbi:hypothetical protein [Pedobacter nutrimenti]|uniref:hypothetical protein n=1 Tax=Pedobacter nutrimenti TaxID=1241337 RepID=UPI00292F00BF|nr:hypothetical protein [Pedobacter nutrimenti]